MGQMGIKEFDLPSSLQYDIILAFQAGYLGTYKFDKCTMCKFGKRLALIPSYRGGLARKEGRYKHGGRT